MTRAALITAQLATSNRLLFGVGIPYAAEHSDNCVTEVDPLKCTKCGSTMDIVAFFVAKTHADIIKRTLKHS